MLRTLQQNGPLSFAELNKKVTAFLDKNEFSGSPGWYFTTVKLDLEARQQIEVERSSSPQVISLVEQL